MKNFSPKFLFILTILFIGFSLVLYLLNVPFHYFPHLPFFFAIVCYEKRKGRRFFILLLNALLFALFAHELPFLLVIVLFLQLYISNTRVLEWTTFDLSVVLFFSTILSALIVTADVELVRWAVSGRIRLMDFILSLLSNLLLIVAVFVFYKPRVDAVFTRDSWL